MINQDKLMTAVIQQATKEVLERAFKHDASGTPASTGYLHGPNGLMRYPGSDPMVTHTIVGSMGIMSQLQWSPSLYEDPLYQTLTGITAASADVKQEECDDAPGSGLKKGCLVTLPFGNVARGTREVSAWRVGQRLDRAEPMDLFLAGSPIGGQLLPGEDGNPTPVDMFTNELANAIADRNWAMHQDLQLMTYRGTPLNNTNGYQEFAGLQIQVGTGHVDAITATSCPSIDSLIFDMDYAKIGDDPNRMVRTVAYATRYIKSLAMRTQVMPVRWVIALRETLFYELTKIWPCAYYLGGCTVVDAAGQQLQLNARDSTDLRDQMYNGQFLLVDGQRWDVVFDDAIPEESCADTADVTCGCFASDIYILPMSIRGGTLVTHGEYFQIQNPAVASMFGRGFLGRVDGAFLETPRQKNNCFVLDIQVRPRVVMRTPWLAARIENVQYCPLQHERTPFNGDPYFVDGGVQGARTAPTYHNQWDES